MKPKHNTPKLYNSILRHRFIAALIAAFGISAASGQENFWTGGTNTDWNNVAN
jgi:hypothetical protein